MSASRPGAVHPTTDDPVVGALSEVVGGRAGTRVRPSGSRHHDGEAGGSWWGPLRVLLALTALTFALGLVSQVSCVDDQWRADPGAAPLCASDIADSYTGSSLVEGAWPWGADAATLARHPVLEQPALVGMWAYAAARATHVLAGSPDLEERYAVGSSALPQEPLIRRERVIFVGVNALGLAVLALLTTVALSRVHRRRPWDAAGFALSPLLVLTGLSAWDLLAMSAVALSLLAWSRGRPVLAGLGVGVGVAAGVWPVLVLLALALSALRSGRAATVVPAGVTALATWTLLNAPAFVSGRAQWEQFWTGAGGQGPDSGTFWTILDQSVGVADDVVPAASWALVGLWVAAVAALALLAPVAPRVPQVALLLVAGVVLLRPSFEPHQALWLLPLAVLARPRWRDLLIWQGCAVAFAALHAWWLGGLLAPGGNGMAGFYWVGIGVHVLGTCWLAAVVVRDVWWSAADPLAEERTAGQVTTMRSNDVAV